MAVEVIRAGGELIVSIDGVVAVATSHMASPEDGLGFLVDSGQIAVAGCAVSHIRL
jgi:hypothetical protein